jgi:fructose-1,6-bisphosphatase/inositol monophosphatase family enzyme
MTVDAIPKAELVAALKAAARQAILPRFRSLAPGEISEKSGPNDLVTVADTEAEALVIAALARSWPEARVLGEESVARDPALRAVMAEADPAVILDPVDGTWNFARGVSTFGMLLAVARAGRPVWGVIYDPVWDHWIEADGATSTLHAGGRAHRLATARPRPRERLTGFLPEGLFPPDRRRAAALAGTRFGRMTSLRCAAHEYWLLAQGHVDFAVSGPVPHPWDHAAGFLAVTGAGGVLRFLDGAPYDLTRREGVLLAAASEEVWQMLARDFADLV